VGDHFQGPGNSHYYEDFQNQKTPGNTFLIIVSGNSCTAPVFDQDEDGDEEAEDVDGDTDVDVEVEVEELRVGSVGGGSVFLAQETGILTHVRKGPGAGTIAVH